MKILQIIQKKQLRGAEVFASQLSGHLASLNNQVKLVSLLDGKDQLPFEGDIISLNANLAKKWFDISAWKRLARLIKEFNPDIIQANAGDTLKYAVFSKLFFRWKQPIVFRNASMVSMYVKTRFARKLQRFFFNQVSHIFSVSQFTANDLMKNFGVKKDCITVIPVGVEEKSFKKLPAFDNGTINLIHVGGFSFEKNHEGLLSIFASLSGRHPSMKLWLVGEGPLKNSIKDKAVQMGLADKIEWVGFVNNPLDYIHSADVLLLPSIIEGLPGVIIESFYCNTPVVAYNVGGISELVEDRITGMLVTKGDQKGFATAVESVVGMNSDSRKKITDTAFEKVKHNYLNARIASKVQDSYKHLIAR